MAAARGRTTADRGVVSHLKKSVGSTGNVTNSYHARVKKKLEDGSYGYVCQLPGNVQDIEETLRRKFRGQGGHYRVFFHYNTGEVVKEVPPIDVVLCGIDGEVEDDEFFDEFEGDEGMGTTRRRGTRRRRRAGAGGDELDRTSGRLRSLEEEIRAKRKQKELIKVERELMRESSKFDDDDENGKVSELMDRLAAMESALVAERRKNEQQQRDRAFLDRIAGLERRLEESNQAKESPAEVALRAQLAAYEKREHERELAAIKERSDAKLEALAAKLDERKSSFGAAEITGLIAPFVPVLTELVSSSRNKESQMVDAIAKVGALLKSSDGLGIKDVMPLLPQLLESFKSGRDMSGIFDMLGTMVGPIIEAAVAGGGGGGGGGSADNLSGMLTGVLDIVKQGMAGAPAGGAKGSAGFQHQQPPAQIAGPAPASAPVAPAARQIPGPAAPAAPTPPPRPAALPQPAPNTLEGLPIVQFVSKVETAVKNKDKDIAGAVRYAESVLDEASLEALKKFETGEAMAAYLLGQPGSDTKFLGTSFAKRWCQEFIKILHADDAPSSSGEKGEEEGEVATPEPEEETNAPSPFSLLVSDSQGDEVEEEEVGSEGALSVVRLRQYDYPEDSRIEIVEGVQTSAGVFDLPVELPSKEEIAKREEERLTMIEMIEAKSAHQAIDNGEEVPV